VGLIAWLDADTSNWKPDYGARAEGFRLIWESCWVGRNADTRKVLLQSRRPKQGWQIALEAGFHYFWNQELRERKELDLPPYSFLVEIAHSGETLQKIKSVMEQEGIEVLSGIRGTHSIQVKVRDLGRIRKLLEPFFAVSFTKSEVPRLCVDFE
jgi:primosomal protein N' (replication factor Y)